MNTMALCRLAALVLAVLLFAGASPPRIATQRNQSAAGWRLNTHLETASTPLAADHQQPMVAAGKRGAAEQSSTVGPLSEVAQPVPKVPGIPPQVGLAPYSLNPRNTLGFFGSGFPSNTWVDVRLGNLDGVRPVDRYSIWLGRSLTNAGGNLDGQVEVPLLPAGDYPVYFVPAGSQTPVVANLVILALKPWVVLDHYAPDPHSWMGFEGRDFAPDEQVQIYLNERSGQPVAVVQADSYGNFTLNRVWEVPNLTGENALIFVGKDSGVTFTARFVMMPQPQKPALSPALALGSLGSAPAGVARAEGTAIAGVLPSRATLHLSTVGRWERGAALQHLMHRQTTGFAGILPPGDLLQGAPSAFTIGLVLLIAWIMLVMGLSVMLLLGRGGHQRPQKIVNEKALVARDNTSMQTRREGAFEAPPSALLPDAPTSLAMLGESTQQVSFCPRCGWPYVAGGAPHPPFTTQPELPAALRQPRKTPTRLVIHREIPATLGMRASAASDCGRKRAGRMNEDNYLIVLGTRRDRGALQPFGLFVVADGMGGRANGHDASRMTIETLFHSMAPSLTRDDLSADDLVLMLEEAIQSANETLYRHNQQGGAYMGCTVTAALVTGNEALICNVGDSRTYLLTPQRSLRRVTVDHSIVESLVAAGAIQREDVYTHPRRDRIYRSLGQRLLVQVDTFREPLGPGDELLLCCDGLWELVRDPDMERILRLYADVHQASSKLIERANENGGDDNITALVVMLTDEVKPARRPGIEQVDSGPADLSQPGLAGFAAGKKP